MAQDVELMQDKPSNACCAALQKKYNKLLEKYSKHEKLKNEFRNCLDLVQGKYNVIEKAYEELKKERDEMEMQAKVLNDEKEKESGRRIDLEDEVSALQEEIQLLKQSGKSSSSEADEQFQERWDAAEKEIKNLTELLDQEKGRVSLEKKKAEEALKMAEMEKEVANAERRKAEEYKLSFEKFKETCNMKSMLDLERCKPEAIETQTSSEPDEQLKERLVVAEKEIMNLKKLLEQERHTTSLEKKNVELERMKAEEALKKVEMGKKVAVAEKKKAEENSLSLEKLKKDMESMLALERSKSEAAERKLEAEKQNVITERERTKSAIAKFQKQRALAETNLKKANIEKDRAEDLNRKLEEARNRAEAAENKVEVEKQKAVRERKAAVLAVAESEEQRKLAVTNINKAMFEKDRADDLNCKLEEARNRAEKLQEQIRKHKCSGKLVEAQADESNTGRNAEVTSDICMGMLKNDARVSQWMKKMLLEKEHQILKEKKRADSEKKKAKKQRKLAEEHKKMAIEQKDRADQLSKELVSCKLRFEELQKELKEVVSCNASNWSSRNNDVASESDTFKFLKEQLELERLLVKHAKKATKLEALRNEMLHQELCRLKHECFQFQQRLDVLDKSFLLDREGIDRMEKIGRLTSEEMLSSDVNHSQLISGTDSKTYPPYGGSNRKLLESSAINSSSASFSDRHFVGSQERCTFSVMTSANQGEDISNCGPGMARLSDQMRMSYNDHDAGRADKSMRSRADKSMRSPIKDSANKRKVGYHDNKEVLDAVESLENLYSKGQDLHQHVSDKLSVLHGILNRQKDDSKDENLKETSVLELPRPCKKRKTSSEGTLVIHHLQNYGMPESILGSDIDHPNALIPASSPGSDVMKHHGPLKNGTHDISGCNHCIQDFDEMITHDYMKLLDLDNAADENSYRSAIAVPLSPTLPEVEFHGHEELEVDNPEMLVCKSFQEGLPNVRDNPASVSSFHLIEPEKNRTDLISKGLVSSQLQTGEGSIDFSNNMDSFTVNDTLIRRIHVSRGKIGMSDLSGSGNKETSIFDENGTGSVFGLVKYFFVSSENKDKSSILRVIQAIGSFIPKCSFIHSADLFLQSILNTLLKAEDLSIREKACVFFSLLLHDISEAGSKSLANVLSDNSLQVLCSMTMHVNSAFSDPVFRRIFMESSDLFELHAVIEDFLLQRKVLVSGEVSDGFTSNLNLILNGNAVMLSEVVASANLLVVGASLLASLCSAIDHIGHICEISLDIIRMQKSDHAVMLAVLHSFAHICGSKYLALEQYSLAMTVVKSMVIFLEKQTFSASEGENPSQIWLCSNCPFSTGAISMEDVALLLLENLQKQSRSESYSQDSLASHEHVPRVRSHEEGTEGVSGLREAELLSYTSDGNLCNVIDILSLVEVQASFMSWNWTFDHLISQLCAYLESSLMEGSSAAIVILLGQLGRLGVDANGYEDSEVKKLRGWLSAFVCENTFSKLSLSVQFGFITSLFSLAPIKLEDIVEGKVGATAVTSHSIPAGFIKEWFFSLSHEQQSFLRLHPTGQ